MKPTIPYLVGAVIIGLINLGIFASKAEVSDLRAEVFSHFPKTENLDRQLDRIEARLVRLEEKMDRLTEKGVIK